MIGYIFDFLFRFWLERSLMISFRYFDFSTLSLFHKSSFKIQSIKIACNWQYTIDKGTNFIILPFFVIKHEGNLIEICQKTKSFSKSRVWKCSVFFPTSLLIFINVFFCMPLAQSNGEVVKAKWNRYRNVLDQHLMRVNLRVLKPPLKDSRQNSYIIFDQSRYFIGFKFFLLFIKKIINILFTIFALQLTWTLY